MHRRHPLTSEVTAACLCTSLLHQQRTQYILKTTPNLTKEIKFHNQLFLRSGQYSKLCPLHDNYVRELQCSIQQPLATCGYVKLSSSITIPKSQFSNMANIRQHRYKTFLLSQVLLDKVVLESDLDCFWNLIICLCNKYLCPQV